MKSRVSAQGYTSVIVILDIGQLVEPEDRAQFERVRNTKEFAQTLKTAWRKKLLSSIYFSELEAESSSPKQTVDYTQVEEVGFATGVFRASFLEEQFFPTYRLNKEAIEYPEKLKKNYQFKNLFYKAWKSWDIFVRPSANGLLTIRLVRRYEKSRTFIGIVQDVNDLEDSLDVQSALNWEARMKEELKDKPEDFKKIQESVSTLLAWLGVDKENPSDLLYNPVEWKIVLETLKYFTDAIPDLQIEVHGKQNTIRFQKQQQHIFRPQHDSFIIHHLDRIFADKDIVVRENPESPEKAARKGAKKRQIEITLKDLANSPQIKRQLGNLIEGTILERIYNKKTGQIYHPEKDGKIETESKKFFPSLRWKTTEKYLEENQASWIGEFCLITPRTAVIIPSVKNHEDQLLISSVNGSTLPSQYQKYWRAIERMFEFILEIRMLAQINERSSAQLLGDLTIAVQDAREHLQSGDIQLNGQLSALTETAGHVRRVAAICQRLVDPFAWSRAEFAIRKAKYMFEQLGIHETLTRIDRNISNINSMVEHIDELYTYDQAEKSNDFSVVLSIGVATVSFLLILITLPSFWTDLQQISEKKRLGYLVNEPFLQVIGYTGSILAAIIILASVLLFVLSYKHFSQLLKVLRRAIERVGR